MNFRDLFSRFRRPSTPPAIQLISPEVHTYASLSMASISDIRVQRQDPGIWLKKAWDFYDTVPEMRLVVSYRSAALSRVKLEIGRRVDDEVETVTDARSQAALDVLFGGYNYHSTGMARLAELFTVAGEAYLLIMDNPQGIDTDEWLIVPADHVDTAQLRLRDGHVLGQVQVTHPLTGQPTTLRVGVDKFNLIRAWQPHPHQFWEADSPTRGAIATLENIKWLNASIRSAAQSRVVGGGILPWPSELRQEATVKGMPDGLTQRLYEAMTAARARPDAPEASAPIVAHMPADIIPKLVKQPISFWSDYDEQVMELRDAEIRRYAAGQPLPTEKITGWGQLNHWSGWQLSEEDLKFDIQPLANLICGVLTTHIIRPILGPEYFAIANFADLLTRPDRTEEAIKLEKQDIITKPEAREASGFPHDFPEGEEPTPTPTGPDDDEIPDEPTGNNPPQRPQASDNGTEDMTRYAVADVIARDLIACAGQWVTTHSGRENRRFLQDLPILERHLRFAAGPDAVADVQARVAAKYTDVITDGEFEHLVTYVSGLFAARRRHSRADLVTYLDGHRGNP